ncbi:adhesion G-protein coupled receptor V1-like [Gigantopelta aegis]|uniref:adhesion G-protein coupled receptor V1-like n=1 Tax=Gigantopelta aegis TaxID=1735272 RepID=UPI001B889BAF|nr:adhesion G-protein coupled receptor V1-like [Gigantopelta aegis]
MQGTKGSQIITITDNDLSEVRFKGAGTMTIAENSASNNITVERTNSDSTSPEVNVTLSKTPDGTSDADFNIAAGPIQIVIAEGAAEGTFDLAVIDDAIDEPNENLDLTIDASSTISTASPATLTVTITDDDKSIIEFENATMTVDEGDGTITISLKRTNAESNSPSVTVTLSAADDTATDGSDYSKNSLADVTFAIGVDTASATISILQDTIDEADETFTITIAPTTTVQRGTNSDITITITDDDPSNVSFKNPSTLTAGEDSGSNTITVERMDNNANSPAVTVTLTKNHVDTIDADFTFGTDPIEIIIPAGQAEGTYNLVINDDEIHEPDENFELSIASSQTVTPVSPSTHTTTITDNDKSKVEFDASSSTVGEGDSTITIQLSRTNIESNSPSVSFTVTNTDQTATSPDDYDATSITSANFAAGQSSTNFTIDISEDIFDEKDETFELNIPTTATVEPEARGTIQITITDNDKSIFEFDQATSSVNEVDQSIDILVRRANINGNAPGGSLTFSLTPGTAVADDYSLTTATVNFGENEATAIVPVDVTDDARDEPDETFNITFTTDANIAAGTQSSSEITIIDDDKSTFAFDAATYSGKEDETVTVTVVRTDTMTGTTSVDVQFEAQYSNGEAVDADIVSAVPQILTFDSGITTQTFEITFNDDGIVEKDEVYNYTIKSSSVYDIAAQSSTTITIQDNDVSQVKFSQSESTIGEADGTVSITVDRTNAEANSPSVTVDLEFGAAGLATKGVDYTEPTPFQVTFAEGESTANVNISITDDDIDEPEEMFLVAFGTNPSLYNEHTFTTIGVKITDDDISYFEFASNTYSTDEDQNVTITINRKSPVGTVSVIVNLALAHVTTTAADVVSFPSTVTFPAGSASQQFTVNIMDDTEDEANETFTFVISEVANVYNIVPGGVGTTTVTIVDNDVPTISLENPRPTYESTGPLVVTATRTNGLIGQITVGLTVTDGTAVAGQDYVAPSPAQIVFEDGEASKSIDIELRDDINREPTESFVIAIVDDAASFNTGTPNQVTANILDDDGPATYDCRRPGQQSCANNAQCIDGVCDCGSLSPQRAGYKCDYLKANVDQSPCTLSTCTEFGTCVNDAGTAKCYCDAGYEDPDTCTTARYQVICGENDMSIQIKPIGNFVGKVYAHQKEDTCTFDDKVNQQGMPSSFTGGKAKIIPNEDTACGNTQSIVMDNILRVSRLIYVQYNVDFQAVYDEFVRARCTFDLTKNVTLESVISPVTVRQGDVVQATAHGDLNPLDLGVTKDGSAITDSTPINMGELLIVRLSVSPATQFGALLVVDVTVDNNMAGNDLISIEIVKDSCYRDVAGIMSPESTLMVTPQNGALQIQFEFRPPKFKNSNDVRIRVVAKLCPTSDTSACDLPTCTNKRRKRSTDKFGDKTVDVVFKVSDAQSDKKLTDLGPYIRPGSSDSSQAITCENQVGTGVIAAIGMMAVLLLLFLVLTIVLFFRLMRRPAHTKAEDIPSSVTLPTKVNYSYS